jgi:hypothetical protein
MEKMNERGDKVMGFDHTKTKHHFLLKANGGVIQIEANDSADTVSRDQIVSISLTSQRCLAKAISRRRC